MVIPVSAIIPTYNRATILKRTLCSMASQSTQPAEIIVIDSSVDAETKKICASIIEHIESKIVWLRAHEKGAAVQRNQGVEHAKYNYIFFLDDDILLEPKCIELLWNTIKDSENIGGVSAMVTNQKYSSPGGPTKLMYYLLHGRKLKSYAGKCIGPAWNLLPEDNDNLPESVEVEWLHIGCTLYKREVLPNPVFSSHFTGYSMLEDVTISLTVAKRYKLYNARTARIYHDSQPGDHKNNKYKVSKMELVNRHYVMTKILKRNRIRDYLKLLLFELFMLSSQFRSFKTMKSFPSNICGKFAAIYSIMRHE